MAKQGKQRPIKGKRPEKGRKADRRSASEVRSDKSETSSADWKKTAADNDIAWWSKNPQLMRDAASLPFSQSIGTAVVVPGNTLVTRKDDTAIPGLMTLNYVPTIGASDGINSPANLAATAIYSFQRSKNSGAINYDAPNYMLYLLTMDGVYGYYAWMTRLYGALRLYSNYNRYLPRLIVEANGVDYDDLLGNMAQFRYFINQYAVRASSLCVPARMSYFKRHFWLNQNIFLDEPTEKAQMYMFVPACFTRYYGIYQNAPTVELCNPLQDSTKRTLSDIIEFGNSLLTGVLDDADINVMSGDTLKAYDVSELFMLTPIPEDYLVVPVYSEEVLAQIHNATVLGVPSPFFGAEDYAQNRGVGNSIREFIKTATNPTSYLYEGTMQMEVAGGSNRGGVTYPLTSDQLLNSHHSVVTPEEVMEMTRLKMAGIVRTDQQLLRSWAKYYGTEFIANARVYFASFARDEQDRTVQTLEFEPFKTVMTKAEISANSRFLIFNDHPIVTVLEAAPTGKNPCVISGFLGDLDNYTLVAPEVIGRIHEAALLSAFDVPILGSF